MGRRADWEPSGALTLADGRRVPRGVKHAAPTVRARTKDGLQLRDQSLQCPTQAWIFDALITRGHGEKVVGL